MENRKKSIFGPFSTSQLRVLLGSLKIEKMTKTGQKSDFFCIFSYLFSEKLFFCDEIFCWAKGRVGDLIFDLQTVTFVSLFTKNHEKVVPFFHFWRWGPKKCAKLGDKTGRVQCLQFSEGSCSSMFLAKKQFFKVKKRDPLFGPK